MSNCGKNYHRTWLFRGLDKTIDISKGNSYAVLGPNGAGKSTFTLLLTGQVAPTEGTIHWEMDGKIVSPNNWHQYYALSSPAMELPEEFTLEEWYHYHQKLKPFRENFTFAELVDRCNFPKKVASKSIMHFSSGMKQRIKLILSFLSDQPLVILDEPLTNLDNAGLDLYQSLINETIQEKCFIVASNRLDEYEFCNEKIVIREV